MKTVSRDEQLERLRERYQGRGSEGVSGGMKAGESRRSENPFSSTAFSSSSSARSPASFFGFRLLRRRLLRVASRPFAPSVRLPMSRAPSRPKCRCCSSFFFPDPRTVDRQKYCPKPDCRRASKAASQRRWLSMDGNGAVCRGSDQVARVQEWRRAHPGYWKRKGPASRSTQLVRNQSTNSDQSSCNARPSPLPALQDDWLLQAPAFVGLVSMLSGTALQKDIAATTR